MNHVDEFIRQSVAERLLFVRRYAAEVVALAPDVILVTSGSALAALQNATRTKAPSSAISRRDEAPSDGADSDDRESTQQYAATLPSPFSYGSKCAPRTGSTRAPMSPATPRQTSMLP